MISYSFIGRYAVSAAAAILFAGAPAHAQGISVDGIATFAHHELLGNPLGGIGVRVWSRPYGGFVAVFSGERLRGSADRIGQPCGGFYDIYSPDCTLKPMRDYASLDMGGVGASKVLLGGDRGALALTGLLNVASVHVNSNALATDQRLSSGKGLWGLSFGVEGGWAPFRQLPVSIEGSATFGGLRPIYASQEVDGYEPFFGGFSFSRLRLSLAWCGLAGGQILDPNRRGCS